MSWLHTSEFDYILCCGSALTLLAGFDFGSCRPNIMLTLHEDQFERFIVLYKRIVRGKSYITKLTVAQLVKIFSTFYENQRYTTLFTNTATGP
jgi:hypothetical protein